MQGLRGESVEQHIIGGMYGYQLSQEMSGKFGDDQPVASSLEVLTVLFGLGSLIQVDHTAVRGGYLYAEKAHIFGPRGDVFERIVRWNILGKLRQEKRRSFDL